MPKIAIVFFNAGGGHRAVAHSLLDAISSRRPSWSVELVNLDEVLEPVDVCRRLTGVIGSHWYNWWLRVGWTFGSGLFIPIAHAFLRLLRPWHARLLLKCWLRIRPDLVLSVVPHLNRALYTSLDGEIRRVPFVTMLTDFADHPPSFWIESQEQHYICGTERAVEQASTICPSARVWRTSGMVLHPRFYGPPSFPRADGRRRFGLEPQLPTAIVSFGGNGSWQMLTIARSLAGCGVQAIFLCGRNRRLEARLRALRLPYRAHIEGYTDRIADFMRMADFFVGKAGPGSVSEALLMRLPVIVECNLRTLAHERYNIEWIRERGLGLAVRNFRELPAAIRHLLDPAVYRPMQIRIEALENRAVFEVPAILDSILGECPAKPTVFNAYSGGA